MNIAFFLQVSITIQQSLPVRRTEIRVRAASGWKIQGWRWTDEGTIPFDARTEGSWTFDDVPPLRSFENAEGHGTTPWPWMVILDWVPPGGQAAFASWNGFARSCAQFFAVTTGEHPHLDRLAAEIKNQGGDPVAAATRAARSIRYFASEIGWGGFRPRPPERTLVNGAGDCKDKTHLALALLASQGIEALPVLISSVGGPGFNPDLPGLWFNHVVAGIPWGTGASPSGATVVDAHGIGKIRLIDMTNHPDSNADTGGLTGAWGLVLDSRTTAPFQIPAPQTIGNIWRSSVVYSRPLAGPGNLRYEVELLGAFQGHGENQGDAGQRKMISNALLARFPDAKELVWSKCLTREGGGLVCSFTGVLPADASPGGPYRTLPLGILASLEKIPAPPTEEAAGIDLGAARVYSDKVTLAFPGQRLVRAPRVIEIDNPSGRAVMTVTINETEVEIIRELHLFGGHAGPAQAADLRALREALREMNGAAVLLAPRPSAGVNSD